MFVPLHDGVPLRFMRTPYITYGLIGACLALQLMLLLWPGKEAELALMAGFGMIPSVLFGTALMSETNTLGFWDKTTRQYEIKV